MGINARQLRDYIIRPALEHIGLWSQESEDLVLGTACQESGCGTYLHQLGSGPAVGIFQMEPASYRDLCKWIDRNKENERGKIAIHLRTDFFSDSWPDADEMIWDLRYAAMMCRMFYLRKPGAIPPTLAGQAEYWKRFYNTSAGKGTPEQYVNNWRKYANA